VLLSNSRTGLTVNELILVLLVSMSLFFSYKNWEVRVIQANQIERLKFFRTGVPIASLDNEGLVPTRRERIIYEGQHMEMRVYRSTGTGALKTADLLVVINAHGIIVVATFLDQFTQNLPEQLSKATPVKR